MSGTAKLVSYLLKSQSPDLGAGILELLLAKR